MNIPLHPTVNATLNATAGLFLFLGWRAIKKKNPAAHQKYMIAAFASSALFLASYLAYHYTHLEPTRYHRTGWLRSLYFSVLIPHIILAVAMLPFIFAALVKAFKKNFEGHKKITRVLWPVWMYVSVTGVIVFLMLYVF